MGDLAGKRRGDGSGRRGGAGRGDAGCGCNRRASAPDAEDGDDSQEDKQCQGETTGFEHALSEGTVAGTTLLMTAAWYTYNMSDAVVPTRRGEESTTWAMNQLQEGLIGRRTG